MLEMTLGNFQGCFRKSRAASACPLGPSLLAPSCQVMSKASLLRRLNTDEQPQLKSQRIPFSREVSKNLFEVRATVQRHPATRET